ncbi:hypothetical protein B0H66DRAFT_624856 [Apodospora peruviana]|uniref:Uncharacterized protein n=1 Tax=Apodospora peruviana TaxID=516989 RepID=A0AAE0I093_9PEZI|nr:hypothetical protein B0H66DRAFT_624856 [Apodospora peruviana]
MAPSAKTSQDDLQSDAQRPPYGWVPEFRALKYTLKSLHYPAEQHQSLVGGVDTPWCASLRPSPDNLDQLSRTEFPWRNMLSKCFRDQIKIDRDAHHTIDNIIMFRRRINLCFMPDHDGKNEWQVDISIWSRNVERLAKLTYEEVGTLVNGDTAVICSSSIARDFPISSSTNLSSTPPYALLSARDPGLDDALEVDKPELRKIVEEHFEQCILRQ